MLLPLAGALCVGLPALLLALWFSWLIRLCWRRGKIRLVGLTWLCCLVAIAAGCTAVFGPWVNTGYSLRYNVLVCFVLFALAGGIPSAVIAVVVSSLTWILEDSRPERGSRAAGIVAAGTVAGIVAGVLTLRVVMTLMDILWRG